MKLVSKGTVKNAVSLSRDNHEILVNIAEGPLKGEVVLQFDNPNVFQNLKISQHEATMQGKPLQNVRVKIEFY